MPGVSPWLTAAPLVDSSIVQEGSPRPAIGFLTPDLSDGIIALLISTLANMTRCTSRRNLPICIARARFSSSDWPSSLRSGPHLRLTANSAISCPRLSSRCSYSCRALHCLYVASHVIGMKLDF